LLKGQKMKKVISVPLLFAFLFALGACGEHEPEEFAVHGPVTIDGDAYSQGGMFFDASSPLREEVLQALKGKPCTRGVEYGTVTYTCNADISWIRDLAK
jgi:hypothetical protein